MFQTLGRLVVRQDKIAGLYIPFEPNGLQPGVWEIRSVFGELQLRRIGDPAIGNDRAGHLTLDGLFKQRDMAIRTEQECEPSTVPLKKKTNARKTNTPPLPSPPQTDH